MITLSPGEVIAHISDIKYEVLGSYYWPIHAKTSYWLREYPDGETPMPVWIQECANGKYRMTYVSGT